MREPGDGVAEESERAAQRLGRRCRPQRLERCRADVRGRVGCERAVAARDQAGVRASRRTAAKGRRREDVRGAARTQTQPRRQPVELRDDTHGAVDAVGEPFDEKVDGPVVAVTQAAEDGDRGDTKVQLVAAEPLLEDPPCLVLGQLDRSARSSCHPSTVTTASPMRRRRARARPATIPSASSSHPSCGRADRSNGRSNVHRPSMSAPRTRSAHPSGGVRYATGPLGAFAFAMRRDDGCERDAVDLADGLADRREDQAGLDPAVLEDHSVDVGRQARAVADTHREDEPVRGRLR